jgi:hypothetical protein
MCKATRPCQGWVPIGPHLYVIPTRDVQTCVCLLGCAEGQGGQYRIEIPSTEGVASFKAVLAESKRLGVPVHRVSQGSGIFLLPKPELLDMLRLGRDNRVEVCLFVGPRNAWDISATARTGA